jgi:hypothetical protein
MSVQESTPLPEPGARGFQPLWALLGFSALAVAWTWPVAANLNTRVPHDAGDPLLVVWILWWNAQVTPFTEAWWNAPMMWPMAGAMTLSEHLVGLGLVATPLQLAGANPVTAYNVCFLLTFALSGFFAFLLGRRLTGSTFAGICAGIAFGFAPYRASQLAHMQVLSAQWMPLALLGLHAYLSTGARRWLAVFGIAWLIQALSNNYFLLFFPVLIAAWLAWFVDWRRAPRRGLAIVAAWVAASLPLLPVLLKYREVHERLDLTRTVVEIREFSAVPASFLHAAPLMKFWSEGPARTYEQYLFTGVAVVLLALAGLALVFVRNTQHTRGPLLAGRAPILFYAAATLLMWALALGPGGSGQDASSPLRPYSWLLWLPGFNGLRVPSRFAMLGTLCLAMTASLAVAHLSTLTIFADREAARWRRLAGLLVVVGLLADGMTRPVPVVTPPGKVILPGPAHAAVIELPVDSTDVSVQAMYRSIFHGHPLVNGYSGHSPPHYSILSLSLARLDSTALFYLARRRPLVIVVNDEFDESRSYKDMVEGLPGIQWHGASGAGSVFVLPAQATPREPPVGPAIPASVRDAGRSVLEFDLGAPRLLSAVEFPLRRRYERDFAPRLRIETSDDGQTWTESWVGKTGGMAVEATLADPQLTPMRIPLAGVRARYLRLYPASAWMKTELIVREQF